MVKMLKNKQDLNRKNKDGFTLIEVMLVLGITGLILLGLLGGTFSSIAHQRYNDSLRNFAEYLSLLYSEVLSPESIGKESDDYNLGNSNQVILGKIVVFGSQDNSSQVYSATLVGNNVPLASRPPTNPDFITDFMNTDGIAAYCGNASKNIPSTVSEYAPLWEAQLIQPGTEYVSYDKDNKFKGTMIIARTTNSGTINTIFSDKVYDLKNKCTPDNDSVNTDIREDFRQQASGASRTFEANRSIGICVESDNSSVTREVRIAANGRNTSAVSMLTEDASQCH